MRASSRSSLSVELLSCHLLPPGVDIQGQPGEYAGESKGMDIGYRFLCPGPGEGKIEDIVLTSLERGGEYKILWSLLTIMHEHWLHQLHRLP